MKNENIIKKDCAMYNFVRLEPDFPNMHCCRLYSPSKELTKNFNCTNCLNYIKRIKNNI